MLTRSEQTTANEHGIAIECRGLRKSYRMYPTPAHQARDLLGLARLFPWMRQTFPEFTAIDNLDLTIHRGERVGVIGRNGAGKTTLLKLITGSLEPSGGTITVNGNVQALMQVGVGFHPDFTGLDNIRASLMFSGLSAEERARAEAEIVDFCELGDFLAQPLRTYSLGMQSRLQFACATAIKPEILIVDEILGAGDAYFSAKSAQRMERLTKSGCTLLLVSHSMGQVIQFCETAIWVESGKIVASGPARDIVNRYEKFIHELRQKAKITEADQLANAGQSEWLRERTLEALQASVQQGNGSEQDINRWQQAGSPIEITSVKVLDKDGGLQSFFATGEPLRFEISIRSARAGTYPCRYCLVLFAADGRVLSRHISGWFSHTIPEGGTCTAVLAYDRPILGSGSYFFSVAVYERLNLRSMTDYRWYDLRSRAFEFVIADDAIDPVSLVRLPAAWTVTDASGSVCDEAPATNE